MVNAPVYGSTVPVTSEATPATSGLLRIFAAPSCTVVLPNSCTGSGSVTGADVWPVWPTLLIWMSAVDWYLGVSIFEYAKAAATATTTLTRMVRRLRQSAERSWGNVSGCSLSSVVPHGEDTTWRGHRPASRCHPCTSAPGRRGRIGRRQGVGSSSGPLAPDLGQHRGHRLGPLAPRGDPGPVGCAGGPLRPGARQRGTGRLDEVGAVGDDDGWAELAESGHRRSDGGATGSEALVGLDRIEALGERIDQVGDDHHVGMLEERWDQFVRLGAQEMDVGDPFQLGGHVGGKAVGPDEGDLEPGPGRRQLEDERHVDALGVEGADIQSDGPPGEGRGSGPSLCMS